MTIHSFSGQPWKPLHNGTDFSHSHRRCSTERWRSKYRTMPTFAAELSCMSVICDKASMDMKLGIYFTSFVKATLHWIHLVMGIKMWRSS